MNTKPLAISCVVSPRSRARLLAALSLSSLMLVASVKADTSLWTGSVNGNWNTTDANWTNLGSGLYADGDIVQFGDSGGTNLTINVAAAVSPASVAFTDTGAGTNAYIFNGSAINGTGTTVSLNSGFGGSVRFNVANGYTGGTTLSGGTVQLGALTGALGSGTVTLSGGSIIASGSGDTDKTLSNAISVMAATVSRLGTSNSLGNLSFTGPITGTGTLQVGTIVGGNRSVLFQGDMSGFQGTIDFTSVDNLNNLLLSTTAALNASQTKFVLSGSATSNRSVSIGVNGGILQMGELSGTGGVISASSFNGGSGGTVQIGALNTSTTYSGRIQNNGSGVGRVNKVGTGTLTLGGSNTYTGSTTVTAGTLQFSKQTALYNNGTGSWTAANINVKSGSTLAFNVGGTGEFSTGNVTTLLTNLAASASATNGMNAGARIGFDTTNSGGNFTIADIITDTTGVSGGARGLTKLGSGTLTLTGANSYTDGTRVDAGTLAFGNSFTMSGANQINLAALGTAGANYGTVTSTAGTLTFGGALALNFSASILTGSDTFNVFQASGGSLAGDFSSVSITGSYVASLDGAGGVWTGTDGTYNFTFTAASGILSVSAIPEPSTYAALAGMAILGMAVVRRRKR